MNNYPLVSVLVPVYNGENFLGKAIESLIDQTYKNIEIIIVNDGSTDRTGEIIRSYMKKDERIILLNNNENIGIPKSLNKALAIARGKYIARLGADDIAFPERIHTQVEFMESHPEIGVLSSNSYIIDDVGNIQREIHYPESHEHIHLTMLTSNTVVCDSSVIYRKKIDNEPVFYNENYFIGEDLELWSRLINKTRFYNLQIPLVYVWDCKDSITKIKTDVGVENNTKIRKRMLYEFLGVQIPDYIIGLIWPRRPYYSPNEACEIMQWINTISEKMQEKYGLNPTIKAKIKEHIAEHYIRWAQSQDSLFSIAHFYFYYAAFKSSPFYFMHQFRNKIFK